MTSSFNDTDPMKRILIDDGNTDDGTGSRSSSGSELSTKSKGDETAITTFTTDSFETTVVFSDEKYDAFQNHDENFEIDVESCTEKSIGRHVDARTTEEVILFGYDLSKFSPIAQFMICASGVFFFAILYAYLQELIQIHIAGRQFALFLGACQFAGYAFWSAILARLRTWRLRRTNNVHYHLVNRTGHDDGNESMSNIPTKPPLLNYIALAIIRAIDLGLTNLSMRYVNYPAKTLIKSSRVIFTMLMGIVIGGKKYSSIDYVMVIMLVCGLSLFLHADMNSDAIFHPIGVCMLITSLSLDGTVSNSSEVMMNRHRLGHDEFQMKLFFISFIIMSLAAYQTNEIQSGIQFFFFTNGAMDELENPMIEQDSYSWSIRGKSLVLFLFSTLGVFGGSCACAITKRFGALAMSITTTTRKACTLFLSFALFPNVCTIEHIVGVFIFVMGLLLKGGLCNQETATKTCTMFRTYFPKLGIRK